MELMERNNERGGKFFAFATKLSQLMYINILTVLCCLPVFTAGSALTAMHRVLVQIYRDEEDKLTRTYFASFGKNFGQATLIWLLYLAAFAVLWIDRQAMLQLNNGTLSYLKLLVPVLAFLLLLSLNWVFVLQSRYTLTVKDTIAYAFTRIIAFPIRSLLMGAVVLLPAVLFIYVPSFLMIAVLFGFTGPGILQACFYDKVLKIMEDDEEKSEQ